MMSQVGVIDRGVDAYRGISDVLINFRHILTRAMTKNHGAQWFQSICPPEVFSRLKSRKDEELLIDRYSHEYQDLIDYADFHDLAEMIFIVSDVGDLLKRLATSSDTLCNRLEELEVLRRAIAAARPLDENAVERLVVLRQGFRNFLKGKSFQPPWDEEKIPIVEIADVPEPEPEPETEESFEVEESLEAEEDSVDPEVEDDSELHMTQPIEVVPDIETSSGVEAALAAGDTSRILRELHNEVMALAEEFYSEATQRSPFVWVTVTDWYAQHRDGLGLTALETFYGLVAEYRRRVVFGESSDDLESFIEESRLPDLLMDLREIFLADREP